MIIQYDVPENISLIILKSTSFIGASFGTLQFLALAVNKRFWNTIKKAWKSKKVQDSDSENEEKPLSLLIEAKDYDISLSVALFSDLFENITKKSLIKIFVSISLIYLKEQPSNSCQKTHLFNKEDLKTLNSSLNLDFIPKIDPSQLQVKEYFHNIFASIRIACNNFNIISSLIDPKNFTKIVNIQCEQGGRSASFVFLTADEKLVIKTITSHERKVFIHKILDSYSKRVLSAPESKLSRILGVFKLKELKLNFIILENILPCKDFSYIFDLKGSKADREVKGIPDPKNPPVGVVLKDVNFINLGYHFRMGSEMSRYLIRVLTEDFLMLKELGIMDYSVLLGICVNCENEAKVNRYSFESSEGFVISIGIIDFFQEYNIGKVGEKTVKSMFNKKEDISSTNPVEYFIRLTGFISEIFK